MNRRPQKSLLRSKVGTLKGSVVLVSLAMLAGMGSLAAAGTIQCHQPVCNIDLVPGAARGTIVQQLITGTITSTGATVYFVITDASDRDFAELVGAVRADSLAKAPAAATEEAEFDDLIDGVVDGQGTWTFTNDPGRVARCNSDDIDDDLAGHCTVDQVLPPVANPDYSPLKRINWNGKTVTVNAPFVRWGDDPGQQLLIDTGGCDPLIRQNPPSPLFTGGGPTNGIDCTDEEPLDRYKGGQALDIDLENLTVTMKLHKATFTENIIPYYTVFDASKAPPAGFMGVPHVPKLGNLGRFGDNKAVGSIEQFSNGVLIPDGGPNRFQQGITSYPGGQSKTYSPMWHITWLFWDCDGDTVFFIPDENASVDSALNAVTALTPPPPMIPGCQEIGVTTTDMVPFCDPFQMDDKGAFTSALDDNCPVAAEASGNPDGFIFFGEVDGMINAGVLVRTEGPAGMIFNSPLQPPLIVNCPVPLTVE